MKLQVGRQLGRAPLALVAAALMSLAGGTAATAAPLSGNAPQRELGSAAKPANFTWHTLSLLNGWQSAAKKTLLTGTPAWAYRDGVVYLRGAIKQPNPDGSTSFARLPKFARPPHKLYLQIATGSDAAGILYIGPGGTLDAYDGNAYAFASLGAISYPTATIKSHQVTMRNSWVSSQPDYQTGNPAYAISQGVVYLSGSMHSVTNPAPVSLAFVLPKAAWPAHTMYISVYTFDGTSPGVVQIEPTGEVDVSAGNAVGYTSLAGISFPVSSTKWHNFKLEGEWKSAPPRYDTGAPAYAVVNGVVYLSGSMYQPVADSRVWSQPPAAARTADVIDREVDTADAMAGAVTITATRGRVGTNSFSNAQIFTSFDGIAYPPSS